MLTTAIGSILTALIKNIPPEAVKEGIDGLLDKVEEVIAKTETKFDDITAGLLIQALRKQLDIEETEGSKYADTPSNS